MALAWSQACLDVDVIKWRDIFASLEESIDAAEDVSEIIQRVVHKGS